MKRLRIISVLVMIMSMVFSQITYGTTSFPDVADNAWYADHVAVVAETGIIIGNSQGEFMPAGTLNADQFIKTMVVAVGHDVGNGDSYWASKYIGKARELNIIDEEEFDTQAISSQPITRAQMAKMIQRVLYYLEGDYSYTKRDAIIDYIPDKTNVMKSGYEECIYQVYERGIITGDSNGNFKPYATVSRAEASAVLHRIIDESVRRPFEVSTVDTGVTYKTHEFDDNTYYGLYINVSYDLPTQYEIVQEFLGPYVSDKIITEVLEYVKEKTSKKQFLDPVFWEEDKIMIRIISDWMTDIVAIDLWEYK